jgi:hypothetical protein
MYNVHGTTARQDRSIAQEAWQAAMKMISAKRRNPAIIFIYEGEVAEYLRRLLPRDQPTIHGMHQAVQKLNEEICALPRYPRRSESAAEVERAIAEGRKNRYGGDTLDAEDRARLHANALAKAAYERRKERFGGSVWCRACHMMKEACICEAVTGVAA